MIKEKKTEALIYGGLFCIVFFVCFKSCLRPFGLKAIDWDTSIFLTIAQGITRGLAPFRDFYDNKGPLTYLISAPGFFLGRFTGVWITELIFMFVSVFFAYRTALFFGGRFVAFTGVTVSFVAFQTFFYEVAGTEEYSLPFMMVSLYIFTKYYFSDKNISFVELIILGFCFASSVLIKINIFPLWFGFCVVIFIETIIKRDPVRLGKYIAGFCIGIAIVTIPVLFYLHSNNALADYIHQNFITGRSRGLSGFSFVGFSESFFEIIGRSFCFTPLLAAYLWIIKDFTGKKRGYYIGYLLAFFLMVFFHAVIGTSFRHYNMVLTPFLVPAFTFFIKNIYTYFSELRYKRLCFTGFLCILFSVQLAYNLYGLYFSIKDQSRTPLIRMGKIIDDHTATGDTILALGIPSLYLFTQRNTASRYIYQTSGVNYEPNARQEFLQDVDTHKPAIIVTEDRDSYYDDLAAWYTPIYELIERDYRLLLNENGYFLYLK